MSNRSYRPSDSIILTILCPVNGCLAQCSYVFGKRIVQESDGFRKSIKNMMTKNAKRAHLNSDHELPVELK